MSERLRPGYGIVHRCVMEYEGLSRDAKALYALLQSYTGANEFCWPSQETLAKALGGSERAVQRWVAELTGKRLVEIKRTGRASLYRPLVPRAVPEVVSDTTPVTDLIRHPVPTKINREEEQENTPPSPPKGGGRSQKTAIRPVTNVNGTKLAPIKFDWSDGCWVGIADTEVKRLGETFPACDVEGELSKASAWLLADPRRRKVNYRRFLTSWLSRAQDKGGERPWLKK